MRWSEAGHLSQFVLSHALRQASVSLILGVRSISIHLIKMHRQTKRYRTMADAALLAGSARIFAGDRIDWPGLATFPFSPREQTKRPDPTLTKQIGVGRAANSLSRISRFRRGVEAQSARMTTESGNNKQSPNKAMERSRILVTDRAGARSAPSIRLAHLRR